MRVRTHPLTARHNTYNLEQTYMKAASLWINWSWAAATEPRTLELRALPSTKVHPATARTARKIQSYGEAWDWKLGNWIVLRLLCSPLRPYEFANGDGLPAGLYAQENG